MNELLQEFQKHPFWYGLGYVGQLAFFSRFFVQWLASEREGRSIVPISFWFLSIAGATLLLTYAIWRRDQVIILGQSTGVLIYFRNLALINREKKQTA